LAPAGFLAAWFGKLKNIPATVSIRGNDLDRDMYPPGDFARLMWTLENAASISAVTKDLAAKVAALCGRRDVICLSNAVDSEAFQPIADESYKGDLRAKLGIAPDEVVLGFAGELREKKGLQFLLDALRRVRETRPACLLVIGEIRPSEMPRLLFGEHRVVVTGQLATTEEVNRHLQLADVYLQPSLWDGMPNAMLEAMAAGCFCIGSDAGGIPEIVTNGIDGIIVPRWELHRLGDVVLEWLPRDTSAIRKAARARVVSGFHFELERRQLQQILELTVR
jgi:glycosyltransferase involved in cell wall biosynthesis